MRSSRRMRGFSLVELVIVVVILGVIAAIAIPRISRGAKGADESALKQNLAVLRTAIEMYSAEHGGTFPGANTDGAGGAAASAAAFESQLLKYSDKSGLIANTKTATAIYGPYLRKQIPALPVGPSGVFGKNTVKMVAVTPTVDETSGDGWVYNYLTGEILANTDDLDDTGGQGYETW